MKKLLSILFISLFFSGNAYALKISLECGSDVERLYIKINKKMIEIVEPSKKNKIKFKVDFIDDYKIEGMGRGLDKATTSYDTHLRVSDGWDEDKYIKTHIYTIQLERVKGYLGFYRSTEPWTGSGKQYNFNRLWEIPCTKLEKKF
ncbi:hypothetical protein [Candidatus Pelagibacter sp. HIMB1495]|uniref:hypothetical protein n=1 Tax=unclassified Candidatus Pelagibacter TaxID=2647897 RepID=UPI003F860659